VTLAEAVAALPEVIRSSFRPPRAALVLPVLRRLDGLTLGRATVIEVGAGDTLLLARALVEAGGRVDAIDPCFVEAPRGTLPPLLRLHAVDAIEAPPPLAPADATVSTMFFGAPLRQRARRTLHDAYRAGVKPTEDEVHAVLVSIETRLITSLATLTRPGGWSLHWSLEGLFAASDAVWCAAGFEPPERVDRWLAARRRVLDVTSSSESRPIEGTESLTRGVVREGGAAGRADGAGSPRSREC